MKKAKVMSMKEVESPDERGPKEEGGRTALLKTGMLTSATIACPMLLLALWYMRLRYLSPL